MVAWRSVVWVVVLAAFCSASHVLDLNKDNFDEVIRLRYVHLHFHFIAFLLRASSEAYRYLSHLIPYPRSSTETVLP